MFHDLAFHDLAFHDLQWFKAEAGGGSSATYAAAFHGQGGFSFPSSGAATVAMAVCN